MDLHAVEGADFVDPAEALATRLEQLGEGTALGQLLNAALEQLAAVPVLVEAIDVDYCKIKPGREINIGLVATLQWPETGVRTMQRFSGLVLPTLAEARRQFDAEAALVSDDAIVTRPELSAFRGASALVPDATAVIRVFPRDPALQALGRVTDPAVMAPFLAAHLPECRDHGWQPRDLGCEVVHFKPGRLCTIRYTLALEDSDRRAVRTVQLYGKAFRDDRWQDNARLLRAASEAAETSEGLWKAARLVAVAPEWRFTVQSAVGGRRFSAVCTELTHDGAGDAELQQAEQHLATLARAIRSMQLAPVRVGPLLDFDALLAMQERNLEHLRRCQPGLARELLRVRHALARCEHSIPACPLGLCHGDFAHGNILVDDGTIGIIDFDRAGQAEPAYDVAYFLTHLCSFGIRHPRRQAHLTRLCRTFRAAYLTLAPEVTRRRLALYEALDLSAYVLRNFRKQSHQAAWLRWAPAQVDAAWERINEASA
jgi:Ser/Thr protein kinase RdoA (MazF antagonist)